MSSRLPALILIAAPFSSRLSRYTHDLSPALRALYRITSLALVLALRSSLLACYGELARFRELKEVGSVHPGAPPELVLFLKQRFDLRCFVETGTLFGNTASWAARVFPSVYTIEAEEALWEAARRRHAHLSNVRFILGQSPAQLSALTPTLDRPLFWLDAHWSGGYTAGEKAECPLLDELAAISAAGLTEAFILIDDARMFLSPPPPPHKWQQWPALSDVMNALRACADPWIAVKDDVIIAVPPSARDELAAFWRRPPPGHSRRADETNG